MQDKMFQFTHPVWGATYLVHGAGVVTDVSIHAPRVGCDSKVSAPSTDRDVSIHAPRVGCDNVIDVFTTNTEVSIHAPRVGCDFLSLFFFTLFARFQFTHPVWGATCPSLELDVGYRVSIHAPRVGCDCLLFGLL